MDSLSTRVRSSSLFLVAALAVTLAFASFASSARAAELTPAQKAEMKSLYERATRAYDVGKYAEAIEEYQKAYEIGGDPPMLYNIAQAYRLNDQPGEAVRFYRRYLQRAPQARNREDVERKIADLEKQVEERRKQQAVVTPPPAPAPVTPAPASPPSPLVGPPAPGPAAAAPLPPVTGDGTVGEISQTPSAPEEGMSSTRKIVGGAVIGVGALLGAGSLFFGLRAKGKADDVTEASNKGDVFNPDLQTAGKNASTTAIVLGVGAGVAVAAGVVILVTGGSSSDGGSEAPVATARARVAPWFGAGLVGAGADFRF